jgi:hypothetical protein
MKFRFYIVDLNDGDTFGIDDKGIAYEFSESEDFSVIDTEAGEKWGVNGPHPIPEHGKG